MKLHDTEKPYAPSAGATHGFGGVALLALATLVGSEATGELGLQLLVTILVGFGLYLIVAGAVARGVQLGRKPGA